MKAVLRRLGIVVGLALAAGTAAEVWGRTAFDRLGGEACSGSPDAEEVTMSNRSRWLIWISARRGETPCPGRIQTQPRIRERKDQEGADEP